MEEPSPELPGMYVEAAPWWPLVSPPEEYAEEAEHLRGLLDGASIAVREVLDLGSGGGHLASHLTADLEVCLVDLSPAMLEVSRDLNPSAEHVCADMRTWRAGREFDAVILHDAVDYMATREDLAAALATAYAHCRPGGIVIALPDHTRETYSASTGHGGVDGVDGRGARFLEWSWDPDPGDDTITTHYVMTLRERDGSVRVLHDEHVTGLFSISTWVEMLEKAGFDPVAAIEPDEPDVAPDVIFIAHRPLP
ncbi:MAG: class I SAM-dependent methyltransferase [Candidatus Nanopelagicales bacterium]